MKAVLTLSTIILACTFGAHAQQFLGYAIPDSLDLIEGDHTVSGVEIVGGVSGSGVLTMTDADTLIIVGEADLSAMTLSDSAAGTIVFAMPTDSVDKAEALMSFKFGVSSLNNLIFTGEGDGYEAPTALLLGDTLKINGNLEAFQVNRFKIGQDNEPLDLIVRGDMRVDAVMGRYNAYGGKIMVYGDYMVPNVWWSYHGTRSAILELAGADTQLVELASCSSKVDEQEYSKIVHSGPGVMRLIGREMVCDTFIQTMGTLDLNGFAVNAGVIEFAGALENNESWSCIEEQVQVVDVILDDPDNPVYVYDTLLDTITFPNEAILRVAQSARFIGNADTMVSMNPERSWKIEALGSVMANYASIGACTVIPEYSQAVAFNSVDEGDNTGWLFSDGGSAFSRKLPDSAEVLSGEGFAPEVSAVIAPGEENAAIEWVVDSAVAGAGTVLNYSDAVSLADSGKTFRAYLKNGDVVLDSAGPMTLMVLDWPRLNGTIDGDDAFVGDTLVLTAETIAGVDSIHWYRIVEDGDSKEYSPVEGAFGDSLVLTGVTKEMHKHSYAAIAYDTNATAYPADTASKEIKVYYPVAIAQQPQNGTVEIGAAVSFTVTAITEWDGELEYRWQLNEEDIDPAQNPTAQTDSLVLENVTMDMFGASVRVIIVGDGNKRWYSETAMIEQHVGIANTAQTTPLRFSFMGLVQNPVRGSARIRYALPAQCHVNLAVYALDGREVARLVDGAVSAGYHDILWNGKGDNGEPVAQGRYVIQIIAGGHIKQQRFIMAR